MHSNSINPQLQKNKGFILWNQPTVATEQDYCYSTVFFAMDSSPTCLIEASIYSQA